MQSDFFVVDHSLLTIRFKDQVLDILVHSQKNPLWSMFVHKNLLIIISE